MSTGEHRILVTGSRDYTDRRQVRLALDAAINLLDPGFSPGACQRFTLVHGAARGLDRLAATEADIRGIPLDPHPAAWEKHGKTAGFMRNAAMVALGAKLGLAFPLHPMKREGKATSRGTWNCIAAMRAADIPVLVLWNESFFCFDEDTAAAELLARGAAAKGTALTSSGAVPVATLACPF